MLPKSCHQQRGPRLRGDDGFSGAISQNPSSPRRRGPRCCNRINKLMQINPVWIHLFNDAEFPRPVPLLQPLLALDRIFHRLVMLIVDKVGHRIFGRKPGKQLLRVLLDRKSTRLNSSHQ